MSLNAQGYFNALRSYLNTAHYEVTETDAGGRIVLREKVFVGSSPKPVEYRVRLSVTGEALVINLDRKAKPNANHSLSLFHFLDDQGKPWSRRCDFVVFHRVKERISIHCIEFKTANIPGNAIEQLEASEAWCRSLHSVIRHYTGYARRLHLTKFVLSEHPDPAPYLDRAGKFLQRDHSIRHYLYRDIDGLSLDALDNTNVESIN